MTTRYTVYPAVIKQASLVHQYLRAVAAMFDAEACYADNLLCKRSGFLLQARRGGGARRCWPTRT